jgi:hypothetical protein
MIALHCLRVDNGIIVPVDVEVISASDALAGDVAINVADYGLSVVIGALGIPVPESLIDFLLENNFITLYGVDGNAYVGEPVRSIEVSKEALIEARAVYRFATTQKQPG